MNLLPAIGVLQTQAEPSPFGMLVPMALIFVIFYFLLIRPQQKKQREHEDMLKGLEKGDQVTTAGGLRGKIAGLTDDTVTLEIANVKGEAVRVKVARGKVEARGAKGEGS